MAISTFAIRIGISMVADGAGDGGFLIGALSGPVIFRYQRFEPWMLTQVIQIAVIHHPVNFHHALANTFFEAIATRTTLRRFNSSK